MSQSHQRSFSAHHHSSANHSSFKPRRRYQKMKTDTSHSTFHQNQPIYKKDSFYKRPKQLTKEPQTIMEENLNLKSFINNLQDQLALQKNRLEINKRKNEKYTKQINREFSKEMYYSGKNPNSYLISGVKSQYENMKNQYEQKCKDFENVIRSIDFTSIEELKVYIEALQKNNKALAEKIGTFQAYKNTSTQLYSQEFKSSSSNSKGHKIHKHNSGKLYTQQSEDLFVQSNTNTDVLAGLLAEEKSNLNKANEIIQRYSFKVDSLTSQKAQFIKKIQFLEKLVIEKDNNEHNARKEFKRSEREKIHLESEIKNLSALLASTESIYENKLKKLEQTEKKKYQIEKSIFDKSLLQKNQYIVKLQKEIRSLSTLLSYWKPLDERKNDFDSSVSRQESPKSKDLKDLQRQDRVASVRFKPQSESNRRQSIVSDHSFIVGVDTVNKTQNENDRSLRYHRQDEEGVGKRTVSGNRSNSLYNTFSGIKQKQKPRCECSKKYHQNAIKTRKVDLNSIRNIGDLIRYRLIGRHVSIEQAKAYFDLKNQQVEQDQEEYIRMKDIKVILKEKPFCLNEEESTLISRYIVQDSANEHVYWDQENQIDRNIAKSILKAFVGQYELADLEDIQQEWPQIKKNYLSNIMTALKMIAPKGKIQFTKLTELITGLGIQMSQELNQWMLGQLVIESPSLEELKYEVLQRL